jgi:antitoxin component YwqK of YwqJK toxin-antitoxin module
MSEDIEKEGRYAGWNRIGWLGDETDVKTDVDENGLFRQYYSNGQLRYEWYFKLPLDGTRADGVSKGWWPNGQLKQIHNWKDGHTFGISRGWWDRGQKWFYKRDGVEIQWYENGQKKFEKTWNKNGKPDGVWTTWHKNGEKIRIEN